MAEDSAHLGGRIQRPCWNKARMLASFHITGGCYPGNQGSKVSNGLSQLLTLQSTSTSLLGKRQLLVTGGRTIMGVTQGIRGPLSWVEFEPRSVDLIKDLLIDWGGHGN